ncbi:soluble NSF attachment protein [Obelidium mucronatum]|nr:soluble NSF attachment protein [Obelidium mucronatum]
MSLQSGMDLMNQAGKHLDKKSFFGKPTPDFDSARPLFEQAAVQFKAAKATEYAVEAYLKAAECYKKQDALFLAGKQIEAAALLVQQQSKNMVEAAKLFKQASDLFIMYGSGEKGAECVEKAARSLETVDIDLAISYYTDSISIYESEDKPRSGIDTLGRFVSFLVKNKRWAPAIEYSDRLVQIYRKLDNHPSFNKQALVTTITVLLSGDSVDARKKLITFEDFQGFYDSDEGEICHHLVEAFETYDEELLGNILKRPNIRYLDNEIAKASQTLRIPGSGRAPNGPQNFNGTTQFQPPPQQQQSQSGGYAAPPQGFQPPPAPQQQQGYTPPQGFQPRPPTGSGQQLYGGPSTPPQHEFQPPARSPTGSQPNLYQQQPQQPGIGGFPLGARSPTGSQSNMYGQPTGYSQQPQQYQPAPSNQQSGGFTADDDDLC